MYLSFQPVTVPENRRSPYEGVSGHLTAALQTFAFFDWKTRTTTDISAVKSLTADCF